MEKVFKCSCYSHELHAELPEEYDSNLIEIVMWSQGNEVGSGLLFRLRQCWQVLTKGHAYKDMVCLQPEEAKKMGQTLINMGDVAMFRIKHGKKPTDAPSDSSPVQPPQPESTEYTPPWWERSWAWVRSHLPRVKPEELPPLPTFSHTDIENPPYHSEEQTET